MHFRPDALDSHAPGFDSRIAHRFLQVSAGFWTGASRRAAWALTFGLVAALVLRLGVDVALNRWNRWFFDALENRDGASAATAVGAFAILVVAIAAVGVLIVRTRETLQVRWREWWTGQLLDGWLSRRFLRGAQHGNMEHPEYRISDDVRMATEPLVDFAIGLITALLAALTFVGILWSVGGSLTIGRGDAAFTIPAFMVLGAIAYGVIVSCLIPIAGRRLAGAAAARNESEARFRAEMIRLRENADKISLSAGEGHSRAGLDATYGSLVMHWLALVKQHGNVTWVMNAHTALVPVVPLVLASPKYLTGELSLGEVMQLASAFAQVQVAIGWLVDNYWRLAEWFASAKRVHELVDVIKRQDELPASLGLGVSADGLMHIENLNLTTIDGRVLVARADVILRPGERIAVTGEAGSGKSTLVRAIAGFWPWGSGSVRIPQGARLVFVPSQPYLPTAALIETVLYPDTAEGIDEDAFISTLEQCGVPYLAPRAAEVQNWEQALSSGERQRLGLARLILQRPDIVVMDEVADAFDEGLADILATILETQLAAATIVMVSQPSGLSRFVTRTLSLRAGPGGATLVEHHPAQRQPQRAHAAQSTFEIRGPEHATIEGGRSR